MDVKHANFMTMTTVRLGSLLKRLNDAKASSSLKARALSLFSNVAQIAFTFFPTSHIFNSALHLKQNVIGDISDLWCQDTVFTQPVTWYNLFELHYQQTCKTMRHHSQLIASRIDTFISLMISFCFNFMFVYST